MIDIRIVGAFLLVSWYIGLCVVNFNIPLKLEIIAACSFGAFIGLCLAFIDEKRK